MNVTVVQIIYFCLVENEMKRKDFSIKKVYLQANLKFIFKALYFLFSVSETVCILELFWIRNNQIFDF